MTAVVDPATEHQEVVPGIDPEWAVQIMPPGADHDDRAGWLLKRRSGVGGSDMSAVLGLSQYTASIDVWEDKTGRIPLLLDRGESEAATWGRLLEPVVRNEYARRNGLRIETVGMLRSTQWPWMICDPDGIVIGRAEGFECKTVNAYTREWSDEEIADHAELQAQHCMAVTGFERWHVACLVGGQRPVFRVVERDDGLISDILDRAQNFWFRHVLPDVPPPPDDSQAYAAWLDRNHPADDGSHVEIEAGEAAEITAEREAIAAAKKALDARERALSSRVKNLLGDAQLLVSGSREIATWRTIRKFSEAAFRKANPGLSRRYTRRVLRDRFDTARFEADNPDLYRKYCSRPLNWR